MTATTCHECGGDYESRLEGIRRMFGTPLREIAVDASELSIDYRSFGTDWPAPWRARTSCSKNERFDHRITVYGATPNEALAKLRLEIAKHRQEARDYFSHKDGAQ